MKPTKKSKTILFGALDWGLGHATRSMPLINALLRQGHHVILASSGDAASLWRLHYPQLPFLPLAENSVLYGKNASWSALVQSPRFMRNIQLENRLVHLFITQTPVDLIVSDNRYGLYHPQIPSILISHQLQLLPPESWFLIRKLWENSWKHVRKKLFAPFTEIWVPDFEEKSDRLAGALSENTTDLAIRYIGVLSRLENENHNPHKNGLLLLLSGPEPQRSLLEQLLVQQLAHFAGRVTLVRGLPGTTLALPPGITAIPHFRVFDYLDQLRLGQEITEHALIVARSGYSTIMDLQHLGGKAVFIPTPGQAEQEYLAKRLDKQGIAAFQAQDELDVTALIEKNKNNTGFLPIAKSDYDQLWRETLSSLVA